MTGLTGHRQNLAQLELADLLAISLQAEMMMRPRSCCGLALMLSVSLLVQTAEAQPFGGNYSPRALCVTDPFGIHFASWQGPPIAFNSYFYLPFGGQYTSGFSGTSTGYFGGGIPSVASATTPEWVVQRTSVFSIGAYSVWAWSPRVDSTPWGPNLGMLPPQPNSRLDVRQDLISPPVRDKHIRPAGGSMLREKKHGSQALAEGDRLLREGQNRQAYLRYLDAQQSEGDRGEVYFRQAFALVAMGRYSHAVAKLKRGLQVEPDYPRQGVTLVDVFGVHNTQHTREYLQQVTRWTNTEDRDPDRLFLLSVLRHFDQDLRTSEIHPKR